MYWTDSTITLQWIYGELYHWNTFVDNRVANIHELTVHQDWFHVESNSSPEDIVSRRMMLSKLNNS